MGLGRTDLHDATRSHGRRVIRMESMRRPCLLRSLPPWPDGQPGLNRSGYFNQYNQGSAASFWTSRNRRLWRSRRSSWRSVTSPWRTLPAGVIERLGLGYEALKKAKSRPHHDQHVRLRTDRPRSSYVSYGPAQVPLSGLSSLTGYAGWPPMHVGMSYGDPTAGLHAAFAVLAALFHRERTAEGQYIDMSQWESSLVRRCRGLMDQSLNGTQPPRMGNRIQYMAPHGIYRCAGEDRWVSIAVLTDDEWHAFCRAIGQPGLAEDARFRTVDDRKANEDELDAIVEAWTSALDRFEVRDRLQAAGVAAFPPMTNKDLAEDPHLNERHFFVEKEHSEVGVRKHAGIPWKMSRDAVRGLARRPDDWPGQRLRLRRVLGFSSAQIADLVEREIIR